MNNQKKPTREELLRALQKLRENPNDRVGIMGQVGVAAVGAVGGGAVAAVVGAGVAPIPIITALTGIGMAVAAPVGLVVGAAVVGGATAYGLARAVHNGGYSDHKNKATIEELERRLKEIEQKEKANKIQDSDKAQFYLFLEKPLRDQLIEANDAHQLMQAVEKGEISLKDAYKLVQDIISSHNKKKAIIQEKIKELERRIKEIEQKEKANKIQDSDKAQFYLFLEQLQRNKLIETNDAHQLMQAVQKGEISLSNAYKFLRRNLSE